MASLADELMNDLDDLDGSDGELEVAMAPPAEVKEEEDDGEMDEALLAGGIKQADVLDLEAVNAMEMKDVDQISKVAKLLHAKSTHDVLARIEHYRAHPDEDLATDGDSLEYQLIVQSNNLSVEIDNEILIVHKFIKDHYLSRFPELDSLVTTPIAFARVLLALGNEPGLKGDIKTLLTSGAIMAVRVTAATTKGVVLSDDEWRITEEGCQMMFGLETAKQVILEYVESRISLLAPNISAIVGTQTATKILGIAGGLQGLSRIPHSNIYVLGAKKTANTGFSTASHSVDRRHTGFIYACPMVQNTRAEDRMKAQRKVGAKVALAARIDIAGTHPDGSFGEEMVGKLQREMDRLSRPPPSKVVKALPRPDEQVKNRRGGKRARKAKEAYGMTELRKLQNRMKFGEAEEETGAYDETKGLGMIGSASGKVRAGAGEARSKAKLSKSSKGRIASIKTSGTATSGLASSLSFTPVQGIELIDPSHARARDAVKRANESWFADGAFTHVPKGP